MRADQGIMLGVVGLGAYAVWRMLRAPAPPRPDPEDLPILTLPLRGGPPDPAPAGTLLVEGGLETLRPNDWFAGRLELTPNEAKGTLPSWGFAGSAARPELGQAPNALVYDVNEARRAGFPAWSLARPGQRTTWFYGRFVAPLQRGRPPALISLWRAAPPRGS